MTTIKLTQEGAAKGFRDMALAMLCLFSFAAVAHCNSGCDLFGTPGPTAEETSYAAAVSGCASTAKTKTESIACRKAVDKQYGLCDDDWPKVTPCPQDGGK